MSSIGSQAILSCPETLIFWGAGATASLGMPSTAQIGSIVKALTEKNSFLKLEAYLSEPKCCFKPIAKELALFLQIVGIPLDESYHNSDKAYSALKRLFFQKDDACLQKIAFRWRQIYDWAALKAIASLVKIDDGAKFITQLYNILDGAIVQQSGISVEINGQAKFLHGDRVRRARMLLDYFTIASLSSAYTKKLKESPNSITPYIKFVEILAKMMEDEGIRLSDLFAASDCRLSEEKFFASRTFYLFSYGIVSMNYEPLFLWLLWNAHKNKNATPSCIGKRNRKIKLLNDHSLFFGIRKIADSIGEQEARESADSIWYPCNEPVAQRMNHHDFDYNVTRVGKFFYPHGNVNFRECPNCGKLNISFGEKWGYHSKTLFIHNPFPDMFSSDYHPRLDEKSEFEEGFQDVQECNFCGNLLHTENVSIVPQSAFKGRHAPFIEEIQRDMKTCVEKAKHIVLLGYSLPPDDVIWRSVIAAKKEGVKYCSVVCGFKGSHRWMYENEINNYLKSKEDKDEDMSFGCAAIRNAREVFGNKNVRAYTGGIPQVWAGGISAIQELLYPRWSFKKDFIEDRVIHFMMK